jgi:hypothetical protein
MGRDVAEGIAAKEQRRRKPNILASPDFGHWALIPQSGFKATHVPRWDDRSRKMFDTEGNKRHNATYLSFRFP